MEEGLGKTMHMTVKWNWNISFVFDQFTALEDEPVWLVFGFIATILISILSVVMPALKQKAITKLFRKKHQSSLLVHSAEQEDDDIQQNQSPSWKELLFNFCFIFLYSFMHILTMMLIMTYNGYVILTIIVGLTLGYTLFGFEADKDKNIPVNCCA